jgi:glycosyltransferase involved in cell wall biosynthesis
MSKRIAIIGSRGIPAEFGGFETFAEHLALGLKEKECKVTVFCESTQKYTEPEYKGIDLTYINTPNIIGIRSVWFDLVSIIKTLRNYDVVYMLGYHAGFAFVLPWIFRTNFWVNMDGLEWKRSKWSPFAKTYLRINEWFAAKFAKKLIADAQGILEHLDRAYNIGHKAVMIPYGAVMYDEQPKAEIVTEMGYLLDEYYLVVCRLEPENHVKEIIQGFVESNSKRQLIIVGDQKCGTQYVDELIKVADDRVLFIGTIYDQEKLNALRFYCKAYLHGHSVGGTNPSLLEAMAVGNSVIAHDNIFNREVTGEHATFFGSPKELAKIFNQRELKGESEPQKLELKKRIETIYNWKIIVDTYFDQIK